jgi:hypothetical protein
MGTRRGSNGIGRDVPKVTFFVLGVERFEAFSFQRCVQRGQRLLSSLVLRQRPPIHQSPDNTGDSDGVWAFEWGSERIFSRVSATQYLRVPADMFVFGVAVLKKLGEIAAAPIDEELPAPVGIAADHIGNLHQRPPFEIHSNHSHQDRWDSYG